MKGLNDLLKQAQQLQEQVKNAQEDIARQEVQGEAGGGLVRVTMTGRHDVGGGKTVLVRKAGCISNLRCSARIAK